ncbi:hypothetical protein Q5H92_14975 [Hymenobacter sp. M29]|uniref:Nucleotide modification associated domain-containing protein n=1 Tax=Hymenobacter mellowenesis TaxID=3063995 RepID=A0ABT9AEV0_9BACT|nr:hypothetical protein [Hymenobacter sp. M29]MDO7847670.1 hypothetical protein [Hymenobacter sp. M29]
MLNNQDQGTPNPTSYPLPEESFEGNTEDPNTAIQFAPILKVILGVKELLKDKNRKYGNSGLEPLGIFSKTSIEDKLLARMDDKVARIKNSPEVRKNDLVDLIGYGILLCAHKRWNDFTELQD